ncbi:MAG TPA: hypothetical protein VLD83_10000, partial [Candidatus Binatia bacterium]|nr:hypothetical protein [Candidatus Binatia bacterium]
MSAGSELERNVRSARATSLLASSILILLVACRPAPEPPAPEIRPVRVMTVAKTTGGETVSLTGNIQAQTEVNLAFRIDGRMIQRNVDVGGTIKPGQVVAILNADNKENALQSARASLTAARAQLVEARSFHTSASRAESRLSPRACVRSGATFSDISSVGTCVSSAAAWLSTY